MLAGVKHIVAVASGKGGVGKSTVTMNLARGLAEAGLRVAVLDADIYGPSQPMMLGVEPARRPEQTEDGAMRPLDVDGVALMSMGLLTTDSTPMIWRGPMASGALIQMLERTDWGQRDVLLVDMPPGTGDIQLTLAQKVQLSGALIVTTPQDVALLDARRGIEMFRQVNVPVLGVIENMAMHVCRQCGHAEAIFGSEGGDRIAAEYQVSVLVRLPLSLELRLAADRGVSVLTAATEDSAVLTDAIHTMARAVAEALAVIPETTTPTISFTDD